MKRFILALVFLVLPFGVSAQTITLQLGTATTSTVMTEEVLQRLLLILPPAQSYLDVLRSSGGTVSVDPDIALKLEAALAGKSLEQFITASGGTISTQTGGTTGVAACPVITRLLTIGSQGADVTSLQVFLIAKGLLAVAAPTGYFGALTQTAVQAWQSSQGIVSEGTPSTTGYGAVGPMTRTSLENCTA